MKILRKYEKRYNYIKVIDKKNEGQGIARNEGIKVAQGRYILFLDSDDYLVEDSISSILKNIKDNDILIGTCILKSNKKSCINEINTKNVINTDELLMRLISIDGGISPSSCDKIYKNSIIKKHNISFKSEREYLSEDFIFNLYYLSRCKKIVIQNLPIFYYVQHQSSFSHKYQKNLIKKYNNMINEFLLLDAKYMKAIGKRLFTYYKTLLSNEIRWISKLGFFKVRKEIKSIIKNVKESIIKPIPNNNRDKVLMMFTKLNMICIIIVYELLINHIKKASGV